MNLSMFMNMFIRTYETYEQALLCFQNFESHNLFQDSKMLKIQINLNKVKQQLEQQNVKYQLILDEKREVEF